MLSVIMPTFNEAGNIKELIERTSKTLQKDFEIIVVDDNSPDGTSRIVSELTKNRSYLKLINRKNENGLPSAIARGIKEAKGEIVAWFDCDLSMPPEKLLEMKKLIQENDIAIGSHFVKDGKDNRGTMHAQFFSWLINWVARLWLGTDITDYTSGFIMAKKQAIKDTKFEGTHGTYFIDLLCRARKNGFKIIEFPYTFTKRGYGESKITGLIPYLKSGLVYLKALWQAKYI